jgi:1-aminocyclopropane-1-carboxylate deaminase
MIELPQQLPPLQPIESDCLREHNVTLNVLRLDLMHPTLHGNKWFKLKHNLRQARDEGHHTLLSFGGAWSNHLRALAAAGNLFGFRTIGIVRGEIPQPLNPVLQFAHDQGMELVSMSRSDYRLHRNPAALAALEARYSDCYILPEGGSNALAVRGCAELAGLLRWQTTGQPRVVGLACGTGATLAGLVWGLQQQIGRDAEPIEVVGVGVLKALGMLAEAVTRRLPAAVDIPWQILERYHGGGYARVTPELERFMTQFTARHAVPLEPVYSGKLMFGLLDQVRNGAIPVGSEVLALHSGGL